MTLSRRAFLAAAALPAALAAPRIAHAQAGAGRVVIIGGGFGGASAARFARDNFPALDITLIERSRTFTTCPYGNLVLAGRRDMNSITFGYEKLAARGVRVVHQSVVAVDAAAKQVRLSDGAQVPYDRLIMSPGIDLRWGAIEGYDEAASERMPHGWVPSLQPISLLRRQLEAMPDGGNFIMVIPDNPFRCPPGPYERIKPKSKILALDAKEAFSKQGLFQDAWKELYPGMIEWVPLGQDGKVVQAVPGEKTLVTEFGQRHRADVANVIPPQMAGRIARDAGLAATEGAMAGWCPVDPFTFESTRAKDIHVIGDASIAGAMPKSGFAASSQAKFVARAIAASLAGRPQEAPVYANTCYSLVAPDYGISVADIFRATPNGIVAVQGAGGVSPRTPKDAAQFRDQEAHYAEGWYASATKEIWGS